MNFNDVLRLASAPPGPDTEFTQGTIGAAAVDIFVTIVAGSNPPGLSNPADPAVTDNPSDVTRLVLKAHPANTGTIYISNDSGVTTSGAKGGYPLAAGDTLEIACNPSQVRAGQQKYYAVASGAGQILAVVAVRPD